MLVQKKPNNAPQKTLSDMTAILDAIFVTSLQADKPSRKHKQVFPRYIVHQESTSGSLDTDHTPHQFLGLALGFVSHQIH